MNPTEIYEALEQIATAPFDHSEFPFAFAKATDNPEATLARLRNGSVNRSSLPGGVLLRRRFHYVPAPPGGVELALGQLRSSRRNRSDKPAIIITTDGHEIAAEHLASGDTLRCRFEELGDKFGFFLPAAGKERYRAVEENPVDVKATGKLAKLYDALIKADPAWGGDTNRHPMNQLMMRLIFCLFAEDVGIFPEGQFSRLLFTHSGTQGEQAREVLLTAFRAMNCPKNERSGLPAWSGEIEYVNGGLFAGGIDVPNFDPRAFSYLCDAMRLNWRDINPDIFGSMIQSVADPRQRAELGMHYTSVPNIMRLIGPLFLDELDAEIAKAWDKPKALQRVIDRIANIRVFDPACGSGNFLVVAYRELRARETRILARIADIEGETQTLMFSAIPTTHFYGIEINDFAAETAKLALFIAEYQANARFREVFGRMPASLPLKGGAQITCGNALRLDWKMTCPPPISESEIYIVGNPPYLGSKKREDWHTEDMVENGLGNLLLLDYVATWFFKSLQYPARKFAFVATSSICQGEQVAPMWTAVLQGDFRIRFAYRPFIWRNSAADNAGVWVTIIGIDALALPEARLFDGDVVTSGREISPYLFHGRFVPIKSAEASVFGLPEMVMGSNPVDGKRLIVTEEEREAILSSEAARAAAPFIKPYLGGDELISGENRYCVWVEDKDLDQALAIDPIGSRIEDCRAYRAGAGRDARRVSDTPHRFCYSTYKPEEALAVPNSQSSEREYIPATIVGRDTVLSKEAFAVYSPPGHVLAIIFSRLHRVWLAFVGGRIGNGFRYSVKLVYNTFPVPNLTEAQKAELTLSGRRILQTRYGHFPKTLAELYDPGTMPEDLRAAHKANDDLLEAMYVGRPFTNDTERLEKMVKLYASRAGRKDS